MSSSFPLAAPSRALFLVLASMLSFSPPLTAAETPLTLTQAQRLALDRSRLLTAADLGVSAAREMAVAAGQLPDPVLKAGIDNLPLSGADRFSLGNDFMTMRRIGVMQELTGAEKRRLRAERYEREADKGLAEKDRAAAAIERDTALAWFELYYAEAMAALIAEQSAQAKLEIEAAEGAYRGGRGTQSEVLAARSALGFLDDRATDLNRRVRSARSQLARWTGAAAPTLATPPATDSVRLDMDLLDTQLAHHPEIAVLSRQEDIAAAEARLAEANRRPDWSVEVAYQQRGPAYSNMLSVGVSLPLQWDRKNRQDRELSAKLAMTEQLKAEREDMLRTHIADTRSLFDEWQTNRQRQTRYRQDLLPLAEARNGAVLGAYRGGKATLADVLAARRNEIELRLQALQLASDTDRLWARLNFLAPTARVGSTIIKEAP